VVISDQGCEATSDCITIDNLSVSEVQKGGIVLYPNPTDGQFHVELTELTGEGSISVYDATGRWILTQEITGNAQTIDVSHIATGVMLVKVTVGETDQIYRVVKM
jgi:hypothetical protein